MKIRLLKSVAGISNVTREGFRFGKGDIVDGALPEDDKKALVKGGLAEEIKGRPTGK